MIADGKLSPDKRRVTVYLNPEVVDFLKRYSYEFDIPTINKAIVEILEGNAHEWRELHG